MSSTPDGPDISLVLEIPPLWFPPIIILRMGAAEGSFSSCAILVAIFPAAACVTLFIISGFCLRISLISGVALWNRDCCKWYIKPLPPTIITSLNSGAISNVSWCLSCNSSNTSS